MILPNTRSMLIMQQKTTTVPSDLPFESALKRLEEIAGKLENGQATLDESLALYEEGIALIRHCNEQLNSADGPQLLDRADKPVGGRFPHPENWWSRENGHKAYEMMSCYEGLLEMYKLTGEDKYLDAVVNLYKNSILLYFNDCTEDTSDCNDLVTLLE